MCCVLVCVCMCVCVLAFVCMCTSWLRPDTDMRHLPLSLFTLFFETGSATEPDTHSLFWLDWQARNPTPCQDLLISAPLVLGLHAHLCSQILCGCWVSELRFSCLCDWHFTEPLSRPLKHHVILFLHQANCLTLTVFDCQVTEIFIIGGSGSKL